MRKSFVFSAVFTLFMVITSIPSFAAEATDCKGLLASTVLLFPNEQVKVQKGVVDRTTLIQNKQYLEALDSLPEGYEAVPISYYLAGQRHLQSAEQFLGVQIAGVDFINEIGADPMLHYIAGRVASAEILKIQGSDQLKLGIETKDGLKELVLHPHMYEGSHNSNLYELFILSKIKTEEEKIRESFTIAKFDKIIEENFGSPVLPEDYSMAIAAVETYLTLPSTWGVVGTVKTLRGLHNKSKDHKNFGLAANNKRYGPKALEGFLRCVEQFMKNLNLIEVKKVETPNTEKEIVAKQATPQAELFLSMIRELRPENALDLVVPSTVGLTTKDLAAVASKKVNMDLAERMMGDLFQIIVKDQKHIQTPSDDKLESKLLGRGQPERGRALPITYIKKIKSDLGPIFTFRIDTKRMLMLQTKSWWITIDPAMEVQFQKDSSEILSIKYFWRVSERSRAELISAPELSGDSPSVTVGVDHIDRSIQSLLTSRR